MLALAGPQKDSASTNMGGALVDAAMMKPRISTGIPAAFWLRGDKAALLHRVDRDGDGSVNLEEWESARLAARQQIENDHVEIRLKTTDHLLKKPGIRPYLISNRTSDDLAARYRKWACVHLGLGIPTCVALARLL